MNAVKGFSALQLSRDIDCQYKAAFVLAHKIREALASEVEGMQLAGEGATWDVPVVTGEEPGFGWGSR